MRSHLVMLSNILFYIAGVFSLENNLEQDLMYLLIEEETFQIRLIENPITKELLSILPLKVKTITKDSTNIEIPLNINMEMLALTHTINGPIQGNKGDVLLFKGKELIILNESSFFINDSGDYIKIGICKETEGILNKIGKNKTVLLLNILNYESHRGKYKPYGNYLSIMNYFTWKIFTFFCFLLI